MATTVPLSKALTDEEWKDWFGHNRLILALDSDMHCVVRDRGGRVGIGRTPAQSIDDYERSS